MKRIYSEHMSCASLGYELYWLSLFSTGIFYAYSSCFRSDIAAVITKYQNLKENDS
jgi:hypothetical protein